MIISTKKRSSKFHSPIFHASYGIQNWLCQKGFILKNGAKYKVDKEQYMNLLKEFCLHTNPNFDFKKSSGVQGLELFVQNRFNKFCSYCCNRFINQLNP